MRNVIVVMDWFDGFEKIEEFYAVGKQSYTKHHDKIYKVVNLEKGTEFFPSVTQGGE